MRGFLATSNGNIQSLRPSDYASGLRQSGGRFAAALYGPTEVGPFRFLHSLVIGVWRLYGA